MHVLKNLLCYIRQIAITGRNGFHNITKTFLIYTKQSREVDSSRASILIGFTSFSRNVRFRLLSSSPSCRRCSFLIFSFRLWRRLDNWTCRCCSLPTLFGILLPQKVQMVPKLIKCVVLLTKNMVVVLNYPSLHFFNIFPNRPKLRDIHRHPKSFFVIHFPYLFLLPFVPSLSS